MKHKLLFLFSLIVLFSVLSFAQEAPYHRVVYLWDVTYSTHGGYMGGKTAKHVMVAGEPMKIEQYNSKYDIYDKLVDALIECIKLQNPESEIIVVPFNDKVLVDSIWRERGTINGKQILEKHIRGFRNQEQVKTNIHDAFEYAKEHLFTPQAKYYSELFIFTDGGHSDNCPPIPSRATFHKMLRNWCSFAEPNSVKGYYFLLTDYVYREDPELENILKTSSCIIPIFGIPTGGFVPPVNQFTIKGDQLINLKDQYNQPVKLSVALNDINRPIQGTEKVHIYATANPYFDVDETVTIDGKATIEVTPKPKYELGELQKQLPVDGNYVITLNFEQLKGESPVNELVNRSCELRYVNKRQKTLTITIKQ